MNRARVEKLLTTLRKPLPEDVQFDLENFAKAPSRVRCGSSCCACGDYILDNSNCGLVLVFKARRFDSDGIFRYPDKVVTTWSELLNDPEMESSRYFAAIVDTVDRTMAEKYEGSMWDLLDDHFEWRASKFLFDPDEYPRNATKEMVLRRTELLVKFNGDQDAVEKSFNRE